ncbi:hypothetical protein A3J15_00845 [Candidatus Roizmanbacteria bacterium RIFCSPLOWO2_02_FULL_38_10]|uniref:AAA+ ATPase domain-containing protein n=1 Tax=Candidatus Roizmanbacteria bacterium RIFCSPLOWO2_02_FULL_38_10 TaxID=1802074 RepID=A0A1F7JMU2_9BACT|nr:MAG: hypothetical protein A3J15_00845 [Candidatus Roizmanbacteria bacterium RIFCSPLOWO2_02_FULL_38_10]
MDNFAPSSSVSAVNGIEQGLLDIKHLEELIQAAALPHDLTDKIKNLLQRASLSIRYGVGLNQIDGITKYVEWLTTLPWNKKTNDILDVTAAKKIMDKNHYGLLDIKQRILEYLSILILQSKKTDFSNFHAPVLFFTGLAGTGKTTFARSIAETLGRTFIRIPFGGLSAALDLRGMSKVQPEAEPGQIIKALRRVGTKNPVILLDELDRISPEAKGEIMGVLIELLDPEQNSGFLDHYIDYPFDLSQVIFIATANNTNNIATAVMDRMEVIQLPSYSDEEKIVIAKSYIFPRAIKTSGLLEENVKVDDIVWQKIARMSGYDPGLRSVERKIEMIVRKVAYKFVSGEGTQFSINEFNAKDFIE